MSWSECCCVWRYKGHSWDECLNVGFVVRIESSLWASEPSAAFHGETWAFEKATTSTPASVGLGMMRTSANILGKTLSWLSYLGRSQKLGKWETKDIFINKIHSFSINQNKERAVQWRNCFHSSASFFWLLGVIWLNQSVVSALKRPEDMFKCLTKTIRQKQSGHTMRMFTFICIVISVFFTYLMSK